MTGHRHLPDMTVEELRIYKLDLTERLLQTWEEKYERGTATAEDVIEAQIRLADAWLEIRTHQAFH